MVARTYERFTLVSSRPHLPLPFASFLRCFSSPLLNPNFYFIFFCIFFFLFSKSLLTWILSVVRAFPSAFFVIIVFFLYPVSRFPRHFVLFFQSPPCVREPRGDLSKRHFGNYCQHYFFSFGRVGIFFVFVQPRL